MRWAKRLASRGVGPGTSSDSTTSTSSRCKREPYDWAFVNRLFARRDARSLVDTYPHDHFKTVKGYDGEKGYEYEARALIHLGAETVGLSRRAERRMAPARPRSALSRLPAHDEPVPRPRPDDARRWRPMSAISDRAHGSVRTSISKTRS